MNMKGYLLGRIAVLCLFAVLSASATANDRIKQNPSGPDAGKLGEDKNYPFCAGALTRFECRVGTWSANDRVSITDIVRASGNPLPLPYAEDSPEIFYRWGFSNKTVNDYLAENKATSLIIIKDGRIVLEHYQYGRLPSMRFRSFSMAKTFTAMLVGIAHHKGFIKSLDDVVADYWPEIRNSAYGQTTIRNLLSMASGVPFKELYTWTPDDDIWVWGQVLYSEKNRRKPEVITEYLNSKTQREAGQGTRFKYATIETEILGRVLTRATGKSVTRLTEDWLWAPMGAESEARWILATTDMAEATGGGFNATSRDYARFGILLANDGKRDAVEIIPREFLLDATDSSRLPTRAKPGIATPYYGYGYQTWIFPMKERTFALQGIHGQVVFVQPASKIVMVQTSVFDYASGRQDNVPWQKMTALWRGVLRSLGGTDD
ncbi:MAG: serine hydrolase domain-containing protein [Burkholderiaceae bacterium]|mgnify:CR=1 FL=1